jgi:hypothetical protein
MTYFLPAHHTELSMESPKTPNLFCGRRSFYFVVRLPLRSIDLIQSHPTLQILDVNNILLFTPDLDFVAYVRSPIYNYILPTCIEMTDSRVLRTGSG